MLWESVKLAGRTIRRNIMRSILTLLGIMIGVGAVIALVTLGEGATAKVTAELSKLGSNMLVARPAGEAANAGDKKTYFNMADVEALRKGLTHIKGVSPLASTDGYVYYKSSQRSVVVSGVQPDYFAVLGWSFSQGGPFSDNDMRGSSNVCIIGKTVQTALFGAMPSVGETVRAENLPCTIVGVLNPKGQSAFGTDQDNIVLVPMQTYHMRIAGDTVISSISVAAETPEDVASVQAAMLDILRDSRRLPLTAADNFTVRDLTQVASALSSTTSIMTGLLGAVAAVSLLVGGIGIMNIMLVSVTERTREIGIRLAIGARASQVLTQFLVEAVVLCLFGGAAGIALGLALAAFGASLLELPLTLNYAIILVAFAFSGVIGLLFGFFPARRAARLDPIEALRHE